MQRRFSLLIVTLFAVLTILSTDALAPAPALQPTAMRAVADPVYVALGDSLAASWQPDATGRNRPTRQGYVEVVARALGRVHSGLSTERLTCPGATTGTLLNGTKTCQTPGEHSEVERAEELLQSNPGVVLVTINIGDNDIEACVGNRDGIIDNACLQRGEASLRANLPAIAARLRAAAPPSTPIVGLVDYDQFLSLWLQGARGRAAARNSLSVIDTLNAEMTSIYQQAGVLVADASGRFATNDLTHSRTLPGHGTVPLAVYNICTLTWACSASPIGHNDHARSAGYRQLAMSIFDALSSR